MAHRDTMGKTRPRTGIIPIDPASITIQGSRPLTRVVHHDARGFLVETLRTDDIPVEGSRFRMTYSSLTLPGQFRDADRWHVHRIQTDRFIVLLGEMTLALYDGREESPTKGTLEVVRMRGEPFLDVPVPRKGDSETHLVPVPPGVLHCIGNLSNFPFLLQNLPTELYNPTDEGRVPFAECPIVSLAGPFDWRLVQPRSRREAAPRPKS